MNVHYPAIFKIFDFTLEETTVHPVELESSDSVLQGKLFGKVPFGDFHF